MCGVLVRVTKEQLNKMTIKSPGKYNLAKASSTMRNTHFLALMLSFSITLITSFHIKEARNVQFS